MFIKLQALQVIQWANLLYILWLRLFTRDRANILIKKSGVNESSISERLYPSQCCQIEFYSIWLTHTKRVILRKIFPKTLDYRELNSPFRAKLSRTFGTQTWHRTNRKKNIVSGTLPVCQSTKGSCPTYHLLRQEPIRTLIIKSCMRQLLQRPHLDDKWVQPFILRGTKSWWEGRTMTWDSKIVIRLTVWSLLTFDICDSISL